jgi:hypothetical protein
MKQRIINWLDENIWWGKGELYFESHNIFWLIRKLFKD